MNRKRRIGAIIFAGALTAAGTLVDATPAQAYGSCSYVFFGRTARATCVGYGVAVMTVECWNYLPWRLSVRYKTSTARYINGWGQFSINCVWPTYPYQAWVAGPA